MRHRGWFHRLRMCDANCGVLAYVKGDHLEKLKATTSLAQPGTHLCPWKRGCQVALRPDRLRQPEKRVGDGQFQHYLDQAFAKSARSWPPFARSTGAQPCLVRRPDACDDWTGSSRRPLYAKPVCLLALAKRTRHRQQRHPRLDAGRRPAPAEARADLWSQPRRGYLPADLDGLMAARRVGRTSWSSPAVERNCRQAHEWLPIRPGSDGACSWP